MDVGGEKKVASKKWPPVVMADLSSAPGSVF